jgi:pimeloyl-ACP methyl ester carboxylesterase
VYTHQTAPTQFIEAAGIRFAYRRFGKAGGVPLVFNRHYLGTMDYWDPTVTDGLARDREVILFDNAGVSSSSGEVPTTFEQMGANAVAFSRALGLKKADVLGFSIGGMVAQEIALQAPDLVRKLILVGTGPRGGEGMASLTKVAKRIFGASYDPPEHLSSNAFRTADPIVPLPMTIAFIWFLLSAATPGQRSSHHGKFEMRLCQDLVAQTAVADCPRHRLCIYVIREPEFNPACIVQFLQLIR